MESSDKKAGSENQNTDDYITYTLLGFRSAQKSQSKPEAISGYLEIVYDRYLEEQKLDSQGLKDRISKLQAEVLQESANKQEIIAKVNSEKRNKSELEKGIEELELERIDIKNGESETEDTIPFVIGTFITLLLTLYLFVFYSSSGYSAFYGIKQGSLGFINPNVFADARNSGGGVIALVILFPAIFLGLGFLIHNSIEKNKIHVSKNEKKEYLVISLLLAITFIADAFIGYKISQGVHTNEFAAGETDELWRFEMIYTDINFYLVLILGFVVYVIWGLLLNYVLSHPYLKTENEKVKLLLTNSANRISEKRNELSEIVSRIHKLESDLVVVDTKIEQKRADIIGYENGVIPINVSALKGSIGEFMGGWQNYTYGNVRKEVAVNLIESAINLQNSWLDKKIESLNQDKK